MSYFKSKETEDKYKEAKKCKFCNKKIKYERRENKFCNSSCAASFNNQGIIRNGAVIKNKSKDYCICCGNLIGRNSAKYCSLKCQQEYNYLIYINKWKLGLEVGYYSSSGTSNYIRKYIRRKYKNKCSCCEINNWNNKPIVLELEHIDGNSTNNLEENLEILCPNCHSQTPTYKGANKGNGRYYRRKRYEEGKC